MSVEVSEQEATVPVDPEAQALRERAVHLRHLAATIDAVRLDQVSSWAGPDTWRSHGAERCRSILEHDHHRLVHAADELRDRAWRLDREADGREAIAALRLVP
jgi:hypothetical protein